MNRFFKATLALMLLATSSIEAATFRNMYLFGDSLTDTGNVFAATSGAVPDQPNYFNGRFTNGLNYADRLSAMLGVTASPELLGGTNYAAGGARSNSHVLGQPFSISGQVNGYVGSLGGRSANPDDLYVVFGGANDIQDALGSTNPVSDILAAAQSIFDSISSLADVGAETILVPNVPDLGLTPRVNASGETAAAAATGLSQLFNTTLDGLLTGFAGSEIIQFDTFGLIREAYANPDAFGLTNVTDPCYTGDDIGFTGGGTTCANPDEYLFWDSIHPTAAMHAVMAERMYSTVVPVPGAIWLLGSGLIALTAFARRKAA